MEQDKKIILCDADDTIETLLDCWISALNENYGTNVKTQDITSWEVNKFFPTLSKEQVYAPIMGNDIWHNLQRIPDCFDVLKEINDRHILRIVTATHYQTCAKKIERILELFPFLNWNQFIITAHKQLVYGDFLIDDGVHNITGGKYQGILFSRPHNQDFDAEANGVIRVSNWKEIHSIIFN